MCARERAVPCRAPRLLILQDKRELIRESSTEFWQAIDGLANLVVGCLEESVTQGHVPWC